MKKFILFAVLSAVAVVSRAGDKGTTAAGFLKEGAGARAAGMGEAYSALVDEAGAIYWNPAALATLRRPSVTLMHSASVASMSYEFAAYGQKLGDKGGFGLGVQRQSAGSLGGRDESGFETGGFSPVDTAFLAGAARRLGPVSLGASAKLVQSKIVKSASTAAADLGVLWPGTAGGKWSAALTATNLGGKLRYEKDSEQLPSAWRAGIGYRPSGSWALGLDAVVPNDNGGYLAAGAEWIAASNDRYSLAIRAGYNGRSSGNEGGSEGFAAGLGFGFRGVGVDYAFVPMGDLGQSHRISLSYSFGL
jgi:hypothetical protein